MAIMARWRMPPESWCGYSVARCSGSGMSHKTQHLDGLAMRGRAFDVLVQAPHSAICPPIVMTGLSEVIGSWKIMEMSLPRSRPHGLFVEAQEIDAGKLDGSADDPARRIGNEPQHRAAP